MPYTHLTSDECDALQVFRSLYLEKCIIARILGRHPSSLYRELNRNSNHGFYISGKAHARAAIKRKQNRPSPVRKNKPLMRCVEKLLKREYSPDEIVGRIALEYQHPDWHISHETNYRHVYLEARHGNDLRPHLRQGRKYRRKRLLYAEPKKSDSFEDVIRWERPS
jgi:transposase, IS30 family